MRRNHPTDFVANFLPGNCLHAAGFVLGPAAFDFGEVAGARFEILLGRQIPRRRSI